MAGKSRCPDCGALEDLETLIGGRHVCGNDPLDDLVDDLVDKAVDKAVDEAVDIALGREQTELEVDSVSLETVASMVGRFSEGQLKIAQGVASMAESANAALGANSQIYQEMLKSEKLRSKSGFWTGIIFGFGIGFVVAMPVTDYLRSLS